MMQPKFRIDRLLQVERKYGMKVNINKTKIMKICKNNNILKITTRIGHRELQQPS